MKRVIEAYQFSVLYDGEEDRLRIIANPAQPSERVDFWLTRRFLLTLYMQIEAYLDAHVEAVDEREIAALLNGERGSGNNGANDQAKAAKRPSSGEAIVSGSQPQAIEAELLENIQIRLVGDELFLLILSSKRYEVQSQMNGVELHAFLKMLLRQAPVGEWGLSVALLRR